MACCASNGGDPDSKKRSDDIDKMLIAQRDTLRRTVKVLLLGAGESGKSTFLKQMRIIHGEDFKEADCEEFRSTIYTNIMKAGKVLIQARELLSDPEIPWGDEGNARHADLIAAAPSNVEQYSDMAPYFAALEELWLDSGIQATFARRSQFHIGDSTEYFFKQIKTLSSPEYLPSKQDVLCSRKATRGIHEYDLAVKKVPFKFVDVGGQRSQRTKWFQCFDDVTSILYLVSSSAFDTTLVEDRTTNRLVESLKIFNTIANNRCFRNVSIILFLNKSDLLEQKVKVVNIADYHADFPASSDPHNLNDVQKYLVSRFGRERKDSEKLLFHHFTTATDTKNIKFVFEAVRTTILEGNLEELMLD
ncbi:guanine nucleotide-binding protein subunit alpha-13-like isoform X3 [Sycon ciliatum]|uniref:guanine nucleotide-binding protein subunit alpha-13-like isoform X3 n=1 Tax=Sycon ciliatum TaxID=27933 RepID=UPI0020AA605F|eukprot:scpid35895/ scgid10116/ Guanine nucleotide-binding protein subunit alpha-13